MKILDLFSGIGGFSVAGHALGWETAAFVERDKFCQAVLKTQFGDGIEIYDDITTFSGKPFRGRCDIVTAGFPCQPFSAAGQRRGDTDDRFLWPETVRIVDEARPEWCVFENVAGLLSMVESDTLSELEIEALQLFHEDIDTPVTKTVERIHRRIIGRIIGDLEAIGYSPLRMPDGTPVILCLPACAVGAWHRRDRLWIVAFDAANDRSEEHHRLSGRGRQEMAAARNADSDVADSNGSGLERRGIHLQSRETRQSEPHAYRADSDVTNCECSERRPNSQISAGRQQEAVIVGNGVAASANSECPDGRREQARHGQSSRASERESIKNGDRNAANLGGSGLQRRGREHELSESRGQEQISRIDRDSRDWQFDHWLEAAGELCRVVHGLPEELDAADVQTLEQAVKCLGREEAERAVGFDLGEIENRVWRTERLKALGNTIYPEVVLQVFGVIEKLKKAN